MSKAIVIPKERTAFRPLLMAAEAALAVSLLVICGSTSAARAARRADTAPAHKIYVTSFCDNAVTAYPAGKTGNIAPSASATGLGLPMGVAVDSRGKIYVANAACNSITVYAPGSNGTASPIAVISGPHTGLSGPMSVAVDSKGKIYALNQCGMCSIGFAPVGGQSVTVYAPGSNGDAKPIETISGTHTGLSFPSHIAVDSKGRIYVVNGVQCSSDGSCPGGFDVTVYQPGSNGNAAPIATVSGLDVGSGIAIDPKGRIYVLGAVSNLPAILVFAPGSNGAASPIAIISGPSTGLNFPSAIAVDSQGQIYLANNGTISGPVTNPTVTASSVTVYAPGSSGDAAPVATISGPDTALRRTLSGIAADSQGNIYVTNLGEAYAQVAWSAFFPPQGSDSITVYAPGSNGDAKPVAAISGPDAGLNWPTGVAVDSKGQTYVASWRGSSIKVYAPGSNAGPIATISGPHTGLSWLTGVAVGPTGEIYAVGENPNVPGDVVQITAYAPGSNGDATPLIAISGPDTDLKYPPSGVAVDSNGQIYAISAVQNGGTYQPAVLIYASGSNSDAKPIAVISGPDTGLVTPGSVAVDSKGRIYVADRIGVSQSGLGYVLVYAPGSDGDAKPFAKISGALTGLARPMAIALDSTGQIYVANANGAVTVYAPGSKDNTRPTATIAGTRTLLFAGFFPSVVLWQGIAVNP